MSLSLRDQLVQAGLATKKQSQKAKQSKQDRKQGKRRQAHAQRDEAVQAQDAAKREADRSKNAALEAKRQARAANKALDQMIEAHRVEVDEAKADQQFHFTIHGRFRPVYVTAAQRKDLAAGKLGIVVHRERTHLVPKAAAKKMHAKAPHHVWHVDLVDEDGDNKAAVDPAYEDDKYQVPDDLVW